MFFSSRKRANLAQFEWHLVFLILVLLAGILYLSSLLLSEQTKISSILSLAADFALLASGLVAVYGLLLLLYRIESHMQFSTEKMDSSVEMLTRQNGMLSQISQAARLSDAAKEIVFRDTEQMELGEAVLTKLHQHDFDSSFAMIDELSQQPKYKLFGDRLRQTAQKYRSATEEGRINQIIAHIESLFDRKLWIQAAAQIDNLIKTFPHSDKAKTMLPKLRERKDRQKRELLAQWDLAVREKNTDRSLEILKELDLYLTPNEALALRESASDVFRTKLHNLGVDFSVAVTEQNWAKAYDTGRQIVQDFPNSRMAAEIRGKMDILFERSKQTTKAG